MKRWGGSIGAVSEYGKGTEFTLNLPVASVDVSPEDNMLQKTKVAMFSLNEDVIDFTDDKLSKWGIRASSFEDFDAMVSAVNERVKTDKAFDIVILDIKGVDAKSSELISKLGSKGRKGEFSCILFDPEEDKGADSLRALEGFSAVLHAPIQDDLLYNAIYASEAAYVETSNVIDLHGRKKRSSECKSTRILVAENNPINQELIIKILGGAGYSADIVSDGEQALDKLADNIYDLVLLDINMPKTSGIDVLKAFRVMDTSWTVPVVMMSADVSEETERECLDIGASKYLHKPLDIELLLNIIHECDGEENTAEEVESVTPVKSGFAAVDEEKFHTVMKLMIDKKGRSRIISLYSDTASKYLGSMEQHAISCEIQGFLDDLHTLKGSSGEIGLSALSGLCGEAEDACYSDTDNMSGVVARLRKENADGLKLLREIAPTFDDD